MIVCHWCGEPPVKGITSRIMRELHSVCTPCGEREYQECLKFGKGYPSSVEFSEIAKRLRRGEKSMTFTLRRMSGKGVRMLARYLAMMKLTGFIGGTPDEFYSRYMEATGQTRVECEDGFTKCTDHFEERLREEEGYISSDAVQRIAADVARKLGPGMWLEAEVEADHHRNGVDPAPRSRIRSATVAPPTGTVATLVKRLQSATDPTEKRKLRRQLRKMGHRGGSHGE